MIEQKLLLLLYKLNLIPDKRIVNTFNLIEKNNGLITINRICELIGISARQLNRNFEKYLGISPKYYSRIVRFSNLLKNIIERNKFEDFADLSYNCGYSDQAHMIHECTDFTGLTPTEIINKF